MVKEHFGSMIKETFESMIKKPFWPLIKKTNWSLDCEKNSLTMEKLFDCGKLTFLTVEKIDFEINANI